jgi:hypothetical protein
VILPSIVVYTLANSSISIIVGAGRAFLVVAKAATYPLRAAFARPDVALAGVKIREENGWSCVELTDRGGEDDGFELLDADEASS